MKQTPRPVPRDIEQNITNEPAIIEKEEATIRSLDESFAAASIELNDSGWDSRAYSIQDGRYYVKFPRTEKFRQRYAYQVAALEAARDLQTPVRVPILKWKGDHNEYIGYEAVSGDILEELMPTLGVDQKRDIGAKLGLFLKEFHKLQIDDVRPMGIDEEIAQIQRWYDNGRPVIKSHLTTQELAKLDLMVAEVWPMRLRDLGATLTVCHGDLHTENIVYASGQLGIIDFGDACKADHSKDFADIADPIILAAALDAYDSDDDALREKIILRADMIEVITTSAKLYKFGDQASSKNISKIRESLERY